MAKIIIVMEHKRFLKLRDGESYKIAFHLSNYVWHVIIRWDRFARGTLGAQFVRSVDSISANLAEGFGRFGKKDKIRFYRIALGSVTESLDWNQKSKVRKLINQEEYEHIFSELMKLPKAINSQIKTTNEKLTI